MQATQARCSHPPRGRSVTTDSGQQKLTKTIAAAVQHRASHASSDQNPTLLVDRVIQWLSRTAYEVKNCWKEFQLRRACDAFIKRVPSCNDIYGELGIWDAKKILETAIAGFNKTGACSGDNPLFNILVECLRTCNEEKLFKIVRLLADSTGCDTHFPNVKKNRGDLLNFAIKVVAEKVGGSISRELTSFRGLDPDEKSHGGGWWVNGNRIVDVDSEFAGYFNFVRLMNGVGVKEREELGEAVIKIIGGELSKAQLTENKVDHLRAMLSTYRFALAHPKADREIVEQIHDGSCSGNARHFYALLLKKFDGLYGKIEMIHARDDSWCD